VWEQTLPGLKYILAYIVVAYAIATLVLASPNIYDKGSFLTCFADLLLKIELAQHG
jgi:hypothetical protein